MPKFTHLHIHSHYSLLDGLAKIDDIVSRVKELGMDSIAVTDHGALYGAVEFYKKATKAGIKPILGVETYVAPRDRFSKEPGERYHHLILLAENEIGWKNLVKLVTKAHLEGFYYKPRVDKDLLREHHEGLIALSACLGGEVARALLADKPKQAEEIAREYEIIFGKGNYFLEIQKHPHIPDSEKIEANLIALSKATGIPLVATQDSHYARPEDAEYHDVLLAVQTGNKLSDDDRLSMKEDNFAIISPEDMAKRFSAVPEAIEITAKIAERCNVTLALGNPILPDFPKPPGKTANDYLRELVMQELVKRFPQEEQTQEVLARINYELDVIVKTGFADYFLIVQDLVNWAKTHGIAVGPGRGSAAGSIVSYIINITDINPLSYGLLFERFLNPERVQMPDIDIDFSDRRRDEVLAYAREKYGEDHVARIITFGTMAARAAVRDAGRAMGLSYGFCDQIAKFIPFSFKLKDAIEKVPELAELYAKNEDAKKVLDVASHLEGVARHASVHACATVISKDPLMELVPLQFAPQDQSTIITQFEMHAIEDLGLLKIDFLGLKNLTIIEDAVRLIKDTRGVDIDISNIPLDDEKTFQLLQAADTTGVFQFESSGMKRYMKDLKPTRIEDLIALVALFRPGPMELIPTYINRKHGKEKITYLHPIMKEILESTYGVIVYQEQVMDMATKLAGLTRGEGYLLIKAVGKKIKSLLDEQREKFINGCLKNNIPQSIADRTWELIEPFARYGFNKAHSACYATIAYRTAYLKAHYPEEFMAGLLNAEMSDLDRIALLIGEAKQSGLEILPPDINKSFVSFTPEGPKIRFGLLAIKNVGSEITRNIIEERIRGGEFKSLEDLLKRVQHKDLNKKSLESMAKCGALESLGVERNQVLQNLDDVLRFSSSLKKGLGDNGRANSLFGAAPTPTLKLKPAIPAIKEEKLKWEKELLGFYLSDHPMNSHTQRIIEAKASSVETLRKLKDVNGMVRCAGLITKVHKIFTKTGQPMLFATIEDKSQQSIEVVVFNSILVKNAAIWENNNVVLVDGRMNWRDNEPKIICEEAVRLEA
ncbi:MAG: DNA polymerase III subunit alpha [Patescibacteria group bacterium]|nr:DNA polymerase III subunit alpha [Patescibacteria group bacterium]MDE2015581.1 DNA polymerase III subunit alpha [Patescibacteria group bacterium]MDE2227223.1 DNA polymerase III subunit alpha [Patescibacteria group bacterium]